MQLRKNILFKNVLYSYSKPASHGINIKEKNSGRARWLMPVIPELREAEAGGSRSQVTETILVNMVKPVSTKKIQKISWAWWRVPVIPATQEAEAGGLRELRSLRLW